jgi:hypothetical protein
MTPTLAELEESGCVSGNSGRPMQILTSTAPLIGPGYEPYHVTIARGLSVYNPGDHAVAEFVGTINQLDGNYNQTSGSHMVTGGDVTADGIGLKPHKHVEQGDGNVTSSSIS